MIRPRPVLGLLAVALWTVPAWTSAQEATQAPRARGKVPVRGSAPAQEAAGVITKVEPVTRIKPDKEDTPEAAKNGKELPRTVRLTINTAAVWRDWVRDQTLSPDKAKEQTPEQAAKAGENSIATKGEPQAKESLVVVDLGPDTRVETRFRVADDAVSPGESTPEAAVKAADEPTVPKASPKGKRKSAKAKKADRATPFKQDDLKPGLFVEVVYKHLDAQNSDRASSVRVVRPVDANGSAGAPTGEGAPKSEPPTP